jgi:hypothetical protein
LECPRLFKLTTTNVSKEVGWISYWREHFATMNT